MIAPLFAIAGLACLAAAWWLPVHFVAFDRSAGEWAERCLRYQTARDFTERNSITLGPVSGRGLAGVQDPLAPASRIVAVSRETVSTRFHNEGV